MQGRFLSSSLCAFAAQVYAADRFQVTGKEEDRGKKSHHERNFCKVQQLHRVC